MLKGFERGESTEDQKLKKQIKQINECLDSQRIQKLLAFLKLAADQINQESNDYLKEQEKKRLNITDNFLQFLDYLDLEVLLERKYQELKIIIKSANLDQEINYEILNSWKKKYPFAESKIHEMDVLFERYAKLDTTLKKTKYSIDYLRYYTSKFEQAARAVAIVPNIEESVGGHWKVLVCLWNTLGYYILNPENKKFPIDTGSPTWKIGDMEFSKEFVLLKVYLITSKLITGSLDSRLSEASLLKKASHEFIDDLNTVLELLYPNRDINTKVDLKMSHRTEIKLQKELSTKLDFLYKEDCIKSQNFTNADFLKCFTDLISADKDKISISDITINSEEGSKELDENELVETWPEVNIIPEKIQNGEVETAESLRVEIKNLFNTHSDLISISANFVKDLEKLEKSSETSSLKIMLKFLDLITKVNKENKEKSSVLKRIWILNITSQANVLSYGLKYKKGVIINNRDYPINCWQIRLNQKYRLTLQELENGKISLIAANNPRSHQ